MLPRAPQSSRPLHLTRVALPVTAFTWLIAKATQCSRPTWRHMDPFSHPQQSVRKWTNVIISSVLITYRDFRGNNPFIFLCIALMFIISKSKACPRRKEGWSWTWSKSTRGHHSVARIATLGQLTQSCSWVSSVLAIGSGLFSLPFLLIWIILYEVLQSVFWNLSFHTPGLPDLLTQIQACNDIALSLLLQINCHLFGTKQNE